MMTQERRRIATIGFLFIALSLLVFSPMARIAMADDEKSTNFQASASGSQGQISSKIEASGMEKEYQAQIDTSQGVRIHVEFAAENSTASTEIEFQVAYVKLIEFTDSSGTLTSSSTTLSSIDLTQLNYSPVVMTQGSFNGAQGYKFSTQGTQGNFTFKVVAYAFPNSANINTTSLSPSALKIVTSIVNYPYAQSRSLLALQLSTQSDRSIETSAANSNDQEISSSSGGAGSGAVFSWNGPLTVDGSAVASSNVKAVVTSQGDESKTLSLVYPHGTVIVHDPVIGLSIGGGAPFYLQPLFLGAVAAVVVIILVGAFMMTRRGRKAPSS
jgi:hypothetical protein